MTDRSTIRTGIVGLGNIGRFHAERVRELGVPIVGGVDVSPTARRRFERRFEVDTDADPDWLYDAADAIIVTTPNKFHEEYAVDALAADVHVLIEKPLAHDLESAERIAEAAAESEAICMVGFNNRFANPVQILLAKLREGWLGRPLHVEANYVRRRGVPGRGSWFTTRSIAGGGALIDLGVHATDLALSFLDFPAIDEVTGVVRSEFGSSTEYAYLDMWGEDADSDRFDVDDSASAFVRCENGATIALDVAWATNRPDDHEFVVSGTEAAARFDLLSGDLELFRVGKTGVDHFADTAVTTRETDTHMAEQRAFFDAILHDERPEPSVEQAVAVQRVVDAIYLSSERGESVSARLDPGE